MIPLAGGKRERRVKESRRILPKGQALEEPQTKGDKSQGGKGSTNKPKEPSPPSKPKESVVIVKTKPTEPSSKPVETAPFVKPKESAVPEETTRPVTPPPKSAAEAQEAKPPLKLASKSRKLEFSMPSKPQKPPTQVEAEKAAEEDDQDKDLQAAIHASVQAPSSPHPPTGAQGSEPKGPVDLEQQESELLSQLDSLMEESVRLETISKPTFVDKSRVRSIGTVMKDIEMKLNEISTQKEEQAAKVRKVQERSVPASTHEAKGAPVEPSLPVKPVTPLTHQLFTIDQLMAGITQPSEQPAPRLSQPKPQSPPRQVPQPMSPPVSSKQPLPKPSILMGKALELSGPPPKAGPLPEIAMEEPQEPSREEPQESSRERERTPDSPKLRSKESKKAEKRKKKESRHRRRRSESDEHGTRSRSKRDERSRSTRRSDPPVEQPVEAAQTDLTSAAEDLASYRWTTVSNY